MIDHNKSNVRMYIAAEGSSFCMVGLQDGDSVWGSQAEESTYLNTLTPTQLPVALSSYTFILNYVIRQLLQ